MSFKLVVADQFVASISFSGNTAFTDLEISEVISLKSPRFFSRSEFDQKLLNRDVVALTSFYKVHGYLAVNRERESSPGIGAPASQIN